jgi:hypothetical protein
MSDCCFGTAGKRKIMWGALRNAVVWEVENRNAGDQSRQNRNAGPPDSGEAHLDAV